MSIDRPGPRVRTRLVAYDGGRVRDRVDALATEEPLELRVHAAGERRTAAVTMRTPGHDFELAAGFLHGEGIVRTTDDVAGIAYCIDPDVDDEQRYNIVTVELAAAPGTDLRVLDRHFLQTSACGICGSATLESLELRGHRTVDSPTTVAPSVLLRLPDRLREAQRVFERTGGLHAAGLFTADGDLLAVREDVGRHNALDKLLGWALLDGRVPLSEHVIMVSGRASYELAQKCLAAGVPVLAAVSAPSSLAVDLADRFGLTLVGFLRGDRFNVYAGAHRIG